MKKIILKKATVADLNRLVEIENDCFATDRMSRRHFLALLKKNTNQIYLGIYNQTIAAASVVLYRKNSPRVRIYSIAVKNEFRKLGFAQIILNYVESQAVLNKRHEIILEVRPDNKPAINFYLKNGYKPFAEYLNFYEDGAKAIRMKKELK